MAITLPTVLEQGSSTSVATTQATGAFTMPTSGLVLAVWTIKTATTLPNNPTLSDNVGGTWAGYTDGTTAANVVIQTNIARIRVFRCTVKGSGSATLTLDALGNNQLGWTWHILHYPDAADQNAIQIATGTGTSTALLATLAAEQSNSGTAGFGGNVSTALSTAGTGFTISGAAQQPTAINLTSIAEARTGTDTTVDATGGSSVLWAMIGAELAPAGYPAGLRTGKIPRGVKGVRLY